MKRSINSVGLAFGSVALLAIAGGCSHEPKPAAQPAQPTPGFESSVGVTPGTEQQAPETGMHTQQPSQTGQMPSEGQAPMATQPPASSAPPAPPPMEEPMMSEKAMCMQLSQQGKLKVEDVQSGVAIVVTPKTGHELSEVRDSVRHIERQITTGSAPSGMQSGDTQSRPSATEVCDLFVIARAPAATLSVVEGTETMRLLITTSDPSQVRALRMRTRDFVTKAGKASTTMP